MPVIDVLLVPTASTFAQDELSAREPPLTRQTEVSPGIQLAAIRPAVAHAVYHVCRFRGVDPRSDQFMYGFVRYDPPGQRWDEDGAISKALFLSHLVQAHEAGFEFAARIETDSRSRVIGAIPATIVPAYTRAYCCGGVTRRWLTQDNADQLRTMVEAYDACRDYLSDKRLGMAVSLFGDSNFIFHGRPRAALLAAALEGLVCISPERALKQFTVRVPALASEVGVPKFDRAWADRIYKLRSKLAHGVPLFQAPEREVRQRAIDEVDTAMTEMDDLLRRLIQRGMRDRAFAERVANVETHWPVAKNGCGACRAGDAGLVEIQCPRCGSKWR